MSWENGPLPENNFDPKDSPVRDLLVLLSATFVIIVAVAWSLGAGAAWLARFVPFAVEQKIAAPWLDRLHAGTPNDPLHARAEVALQAMTDRIARLQGIPPGMKVRVHLLDQGEVNAFATVGGHVIVLGGLLEKIPHENALVMLLGHEIGHIAHRDPVKALARGVAVLTLIGVLTGFSEAGALGRSMETAGLLTTLSFSRDQERAADEAGLETLRAWYGHTSGAADLFRALHDSTGAGKELPAMFSSHPGIDERIEHMSAHQDHRSTQALTGALADYVEARRQKLVDSGTGPRP